MTDFDAIAEFVKQLAGADKVAITGGERLTGGAIQENTALTITVEGGPRAGVYEVVLRREALAGVPVSLPLAQQFALIRAAHEAGVTVPEPLWLCDDTEVMGQPFYLMRRVAGEALGTRIVKDAPHEALAERLASELAKIHTITPPREELDFLDPVDESPALDWVARWRAYLDEEPEPHPILELGLRWLERHAPPLGEVVLCHHDFRTGNYMVANGELTGVLDWEFAGWSDPMEDIGWICARCWRFGSNQWEAGGIAARETFYRAYEAASGRTVDRDIIPYWEAMAHVRWAVIALQQTSRHLSGREPSLELALIGRRLPELEYEVLRLTGGL